MRPVLLVALVAAGCGSDPDRPPTFPVEDHDAGPDRDGGSADASRPEDPGPGLREGDLVFWLPWQGPAQQVDLTFEALVRQLDLHFSIDTTGSFDQEIDELQSALREQVIPGVRARVGDASFGVSRFEDFPIEPFGAATDRPFALLQAQTTDEELAARAVGRLDDPLGRGGDLPEAGAEALYQLATGEGFGLGGAEIVEPFEEAAPGGGTLGGGGFREGALPIVVQVTDAPAHAPSDYAEYFPGAHSAIQAIEALGDLGARVIGIASGEEARRDLVALAATTGALAPPGEDGTCTTGIDGAPRAPEVLGQCPLVYDLGGDGAGLSATIVESVATLLGTIVFDSVSIEIEGDDVGFVVTASPLWADAPGGYAPPGLADLVPEGGDGALDSFTDVPPGTTLAFRIVLRNTSVRETDYEQVFFLHARIVADRTTVVDDKLIEIRIPIVSRDGDDAGLDAGSDAAPDASLDAGLDGGSADASS
ncbi:MAG: hypothetical protein HYY06_10480 [Deltaproteobacteria bacterium]|nr:hypothetical protein [Deltaproteobacteria bacterium]